MQSKEESNDILLEKFLSGWGLVAKNFSPQATESLSKILENLQGRNGDFQSNIEAATQTFGQLGILGQQLQSYPLVKIASAGQALIGLHQGINSLGYAIPAFSQLVPALSMVSPVLGIIGAGLSIAGMFLGRRKKGNGTLQALQAIHKSVIEVHQAVIAVHESVQQGRLENLANFKRVFNMIIQLSEFVVNDFRIPVMHLLDSLQDSLTKFQIIASEEHRQLFLKSFAKQLSLLADYNEGIIGKFPLKALIKLEHLIENQTNSSMLNGNLYANIADNGDGARWMREILVNPNHNVANLIGYLAAKAQEISGKSDTGFDQNKLINTTVWGAAVKEYLTALVTLDTKQHDAIPHLNKIISQGDNFLKFIDYLSRNKNLYNHLFKHYKNMIKKLNEIIANKFLKIEEKNVDKQTLEQLFPYHTKDRTELDYYLNQLDNFHLLLASYSSLNGSQKIYQKLASQLITRTSMAKQKFSLHNQQFSQKFWSNANGYGLPHYYSTLRTVVIKMNGEDVLFAMMRSSFSLQLLRYYPKENTWKLLADGPLWSDVSGYADPQYYSTIRAEVMEINYRQVLLVMIRNSQYLQLLQYDPYANQWTLLANGPQWPAACGYNQPCYYKTIRSVVIKIERRQMLLVMIRNSQYLQLVRYDPKMNGKI